MHHLRRVLTVVPIRAMSSSRQGTSLLPTRTRDNRAFTFRRHFSVADPAAPASSLPQEEYSVLSERTMDGLLDRLEDLVDTHGEAGWEVEYHSGVLTLNLGEHGIYVINKQPPNKQIWLSSPSSGPKRYDWDPKSRHWVYARTGESLRTLLEAELSAIYNRSISEDLGQGSFYEV